MSDAASRGPAWLVLPTYDEAPNIEAIVEAVLAKLPASSRVLIVDDNSPDGTGDIADRLAAADERVEVLQRPRKEGLGPAYIAGFRRALGRRRRPGPRDGRRLLPRPGLPAAAARGGRARRPRDRLPLRARRRGRATGARCAGRSAAAAAPTRALVLGVEVRDLTGGFKCFRREVLEAIDLDSVGSRGYAFQVELTYRAIQLGLPRRRGPDRLPRPPRRHLEDGRRDRRRGGLAGPLLRFQKT